ncbi:Type III pantothenate kinase [Dyadobacter sp. CECT 9275]|uniref:Type III pantothenate kinase n=1 Tax=Dyadobacter helix TaxID=2822344 RepID=A0A916J8A3_9BACT|nr:type III pantothenate kinase [Dyadobacter sp. CECT 9275]CAG4992008.1 Type III pantothenate kinase [Dyadobacter sp. CECT 9275]
MNIVIDCGNTYSKMGWFEDGRIVDHRRGLLLGEVVDLIRNNLPDRIMFSSVSLTAEEFVKNLGVEVPVMNLSPETPLPVRKDYFTPHTLGADRIAAAVGANWLYPGEDIIVIDMGTCITYDWIDKNAVFQGGLISPGVKMRFNAVHTFTKRLPLLEPQKEPVFVGKSTKEAIESGIMNGVLAEMQGIIDRYRHNSGAMRVLICGGDASFFESSLKPPIFAVPELVLIGLNRILTYNVS